MGRESTLQREAVLQFLANMDEFTVGEISSMLKEAVKYMNQHELRNLLSVIDKTWDDLEY